MVSPRKKSPLRGKSAASAKSALLTMRDVARFAGVSSMTVSNVVNRRFDEMTDETRLRVEDAIRELNYRPHSLARELRLARRFSIGMLLVDPSPSYLAAPFTTQLVAGLSNHLSEHGYALSIQGLRPEKFHDALALQRVGTDGICALLSGTEEQRRSFRASLLAIGQPTILFQEFDGKVAPDTCHIVQEDRKGGYLIARHVIEKGARRLVLMEGVHEWPAFSERSQGVRQAVQETDGGVKLEVLKCQTSRMPDVELAMRRYLEHNSLPDAFLGSNDQMGLAAMHFLLSQKRRIPDDIMVTGFNAFGFQQYAPVSLTTVMSPAYEMGVRGASEMLLRLTAGHFNTDQISLPVALEIGDSA